MRAFLVLAAGWFVANTAFADVYRVGDTDRDACDYATVQQAVDAATANGPGLETILIANTGSYTDVVVTVGDKSLIIEGGFDTCQFANPAAPADLSGDGSSPVIAIEPASLSTQVTLHGLKIHGGGDGSAFGSYGGGVNVSGNTYVMIEDTTIQNNNASLGGGICIASSAPYPTVQLNPGVQIIGNHAAVGGGGVYLAGGSLGIAADRVNIDNNSAGQEGGGILSYQGLIYVGNPQQGPARRNVTGASVSGNSAGVGGGIFLSSAQTQLVAYELILDSNTAVYSGGGVELLDGAYAFMARDYPIDGTEFQCPNALQCSRISNNSVGSAAVGTQGGGIALYSNSYADISQTIIRGNTAQDGSAAYIDDGTALNMEGALVTGNQSYDTILGAPTIHTHFTSVAPRLRIAYATFVGNYEMPSSGPNGLSEDIIASFGTQLSIYSSAFYDSPYPTVVYAPFVDDCVVSQGADDPFGSNTRELRTSIPGFNNAAAGDYRPQSSSALNDYCDASLYVASYRDLLLTPRCKDDPGKANTYGTCDVGAYEYSDRIFSDSFE